MSKGEYPDHVWEGFGWTWQLQGSKTDGSLLASVDATITKVFRDQQYTPQPADEYLRLVGGRYNSVPDMTHCFLGETGSYATCFRCEREQRGLHIHLYPDPKKKTEAYALMDLVEQSTSNAALKVAQLSNAISVLTWDYKLTVVSAIITILSSIGTVASSVFLTGIILATVQSGSGITLVLSLIYFIVVFFFIFARAYYQSKLVWNF